MGAKRDALVSQLKLLHKREPGPFTFPDRCAECKKKFPCPTLELVRDE